MTAVYEAKCRVGSIANAYVDRSFIAIAMIFIWQVVYASQTEYLMRTTKPKHHIHRGIR